MLAQLRLIALIMVAGTAGCGGNGTAGSGDAGTGGPPTFDGSFARGSQPLVLQTAPGGLCEGQGTDKECAQSGGCEPPTAGAGAMGSASFGGGTGPSGGLAPPGSGSAYPAYDAGSYYDAGPIGPVDAGRYDASPSSPVADAGPPADAGPAPEPVDPGIPLQPDAGYPPLSLSEDAGPPENGAPSCSELTDDEPYTLYMSADDSNSMASPVIARRLINSDRRVPAAVVRPHEFLNYYDFSFEPAEPGEVRIVPQMSSCPSDGQLSFQVALQAESRDPDDREPLNVIFVLDTSGSMSGRPIELEREAVRSVAGRLQAGDVVSMVTWSTDQQDILSGYEVGGPDDPELLRAADGLTADGGTDLHAGLQRGYGLAEQHYSPDRINRVVLISDGRANTGVTDENLIARHADDEQADKPGIYLMGIGVGDGVNDSLMDTVTDAGRGAYIYLDKPAEAEHMLGGRFLQAVDLAARAVRLEVTLPWYLAIEKFYGEVVSPDPEKVRPQHLAPNDAMVFFQILRACDPSQIGGDDRVHIRATWETPFERNGREAVIDTTLNELAGDDDRMAKAAAIAGYAEALRQAALADDEEAKRVLHDALDDVRSARSRLGEAPDLREIAGLLETYITRFP